MGVTVVVIHQASTRREDGNPLKRVAHQGIKRITRVTLYGATDGPHVAEGKDVLDAQLGAVCHGLHHSWEVGWQQHCLQHVLPLAKPCKTICDTDSDSYSFEPQTHTTKPQKSMTTSMLSWHNLYMPETCTKPCHDHEQAYACSCNGNDNCAGPEKACIYDPCCTAANATRIAIMCKNTELHAICQRFTDL